MYSNRVKYRINNDFDAQIELKDDPIGWNEDERELSRSNKSYGVFTTLSNNLEFVGDGAEYISDTYNKYGTEVGLVLERLVKDEITDEWEIDYVGNLDLKTYTLKNERVAVKFLTGGLQSIIDSQKREKFELDRTTSIDGDEITPLTYKSMEFIGRNIFLESELKSTNTNNYIADNVFTLPIPKTYADDVNVTSIAPTDIKRIQDTYNGQTLNDIKFTTPEIFYQENDRNRIINLDFKINDIELKFINGYNDKFFDVHLCVLEDNNNDSSWEIVDRTRIIFYDVVSDGDQAEHDANGKVVKSFSYNSDIELLQGQALGIFYNTKIEANPDAFDNIQVGLNANTLILKIEEDSILPITYNKGLRVFNACDRLLEIYTGQKGLLTSEYFGSITEGYNSNGKFSKALLASGLMIRNFEDATLSISLDDIIGLSGYFNLGWSVENFGNVQKFVLEDLRYFFQGVVALDLTDEDLDIEFSVANDFLFSSVTIGNEEAGKYEELQGLSEYNAKTTYTTHLKSADAKYEQTPKVRADLIGAELARRKQAISNPTEDTSYDDDIFLLDTSDIDGLYVFRKWYNDYESVNGVYDIDTAFNLRLTPYRCLERHAWFFNSGLTKYQDRFTRYANGTGNVNVSTQKENEQLRPENGNVLNSDLDKPLFISEYLTFDYPITHTISKKLQGKTSIDGREVPNVNCLVKLKHKGVIYYGWIMSVKLNDGTFKLIRANI